MHRVLLFYGSSIIFYLSFLSKVHNLWIRLGPGYYLWNYYVPTWYSIWGIIKESKCLLPRFFEIKEQWDRWTSRSWQKWEGVEIRFVTLLLNPTFLEGSQERTEDLRISQKWNLYQVSLRRSSSSTLSLKTLYWTLSLSLCHLKTLFPFSFCPIPFLSFDSFRHLSRPLIELRPRSKRSVPTEVESRSPGRETWDLVR